MTYHPSTTRRAPYEQLHDDALEYLVEVFGAELWRTLRDAPPIHAADQLYELVGSDPKQLRQALDLLRLVEAGGSAGCDVRVSGFNGTVAAEDPVHDRWRTESYEDDGLADACRRLLGRLKGGEP